MTIVQVTSSENKTIVITTLLSENKNIESLLINIKNKKEYIRIIEDKHRRKQFEKQENYSHFNNTLKISDWSAAELDNRKRVDIEEFNQSDQTITEIKQESLFKRKIRNRKSARKNDY